MSRERALRHLGWIPALPDPQGWTGFLILVSVLGSHLALPAVAVSYLFSPNPWLEALGHVWLLLGPPYALYLGVRHLLCCGDSLLPVITVPLASFLTLLTGLGLAYALV